jgi:hypothetical protein
MSNDDDILDIDAAITALALDLLAGVKRTAFQARASALARSAQIDASDLEYLRGRFHTPPPEPDAYDFREHGLGGWLSRCQFAIFELIFNIGEPALPFLRQVAWGCYDWTQGNAIELLIRMAAQGLGTEETIAEIAKNFPAIRYEAQIYSLEPLLPMVVHDPDLEAMIGKLRMRIPEFDRVASEIESKGAAT